MQILRINQNYNQNYNRKNNVSFKSKVVQVLKGNISESLKDKVDVFEETHSNAQLLGSGLFARAYKFNDEDIVIKESMQTPEAKKANQNFEPEANALYKLPEDMGNTQKLIANVRTAKGNYYLLTTLIQGTKPVYPQTPWNIMHFQSLFRTLYLLDKSGIYHGDLNRGNCLITADNQANLLDYQWSESFDIRYQNYNDKKLKTPSFTTPSNAQMFEMANLPFYLANLINANKSSEAKQVFTNYLKAKSVYCKNRSNLLRMNNAPRESVEYESLQAELLSNPSKDVVKINALKLQVLYAFRQVFTITDKNNTENKHNIITTVPCYLYTAACAKKMEDSARKLKDNSSDTKFRKLMDYEIQFAQYWKNKMMDELSGKEISSDGEYGAFKWILRNAKLDPHWKGNSIDPEDDLSFKFKNSARLQFGKIDDVAAVLTGDNLTKPKDSYVYGILDVKDDFYAIDNYIKNATNMKPNTNKYKNEILELKSLRENFIESFNKAFHATDQNRLIASIPAAIKALYNASLLKKEADKLYAKAGWLGSESYYATKQKELADNACIHLENIAKKLYDRAVDAINGNSSYIEECIYYEQLNDFDVRDCPKYKQRKPLKFRNDL